MKETQTADQGRQNGGTAVHNQYRVRSSNMCGHFGKDSLQGKPILLAVGLQPPPGVIGKNIEVVPMVGCEPLSNSWP